jgi:hypothetical protein
MKRDEAKIVSIKRKFLLTLLAATFAFGVFVGAGRGAFTSPPASKGEAVPEYAEGTFRFIRAFADSNSLNKKRTNKELKLFQKAEGANAF